MTGFSVAPKHEAKKRHMRIENCRLKPSFLAAVRGDELVIENKSDFPFLPKLKRDSFLQAILKGTSRKARLDGVGPQRISCGFASPCGVVDLVVLGHPVFAMTDAQGRFEIDNLPKLGDSEQSLILHAWHPLLKQHKALLSKQTDLSHEIQIEMQAAPAKNGIK
ncbi:MAG: hypothetical protein IPJ88_07990 [Myxococcales bacterium]|nr:MAG: hypothetical protein IPJ88_07990 [Myxococcales bacterium]